MDAMAQVRPGPFLGCGLCAIAGGANEAVHWLVATLTVIIFGSLWTPPGYLIIRCQAGWSMELIRFEKFTFLEQVSE